MFHQCSRICRSKGLSGLGLRPSRGKWGDSSAQGLLKGAKKPWNEAGLLMCIIAVKAAQ